MSADRIDWPANRPAAQPPHRPDRYQPEKLTTASLNVSRRYVVFLAVNLCPPNYGGWWVARMIAESKARVAGRGVIMESDDKAHTREDVMGGPEPTPAGADVMGGLESTPEGADVMGGPESTPQGEDVMGEEDGGA